MTILSNSRYVTATLVTVDTDETTRREMRVSFPSTRIMSYTSYRIHAGDRTDVMGARFFGDPTLWWMLADANPEIMDWTNVPVGAVIRVPRG